MLNNIKKKYNEKGFTIIEVLIVLAIAGLILLIVFLAVPALQRNSRNSGRKSDIARIGGAVVEYMNNNNGKVPTDTSLGAIIKTAGNLGQYELLSADPDDPDAEPIPNENISVTDDVSSAAVKDKDKLVIVTGAKCADGGEVDDGSARQIAIQWASETTGTDGTPGCTEF